MSRPRIDESSKQDFIKMILTKNQGRSEGDKESERVDALSWIGLIATQGSSTQLSVCAESWRSLSIFPRVSYKQLLKHYSPWE